MSARLNAFLNVLVLGILLVVGAPPQGGSGSGGLPLSGGTITGNLTVSGVTSATSSSSPMVWASGSTKSLTDAECKGHVWETTGAGSTLVTFALPDAPAVGDTVTFHVSASHTGGLKVLANTGDTIATEVQTTAGAGYLLSVLPGSSLTVTRESATAWRSMGQVRGTWKADSSTSAGWAYTPTVWTAWTPTSATWLANVTFTGLYRQVGDVIESQIKVAITGTPTTASLTHNNWAGGFTPSATKWLSCRSAGDYQVFFRGQCVDDSAGASREISAWYNQDGTSYWFSAPGSSSPAGVTQAAPFSWASGDSMVVYGSYAVD